jgi:hypothetical protein
VISWVRLFFQDIDEIFLSQDVFFSMDPWETRPDSGVPILFRLQGEIDIDRIRRGVIKSVIQCQREDKSLKYDKLQQYPVKVGGFNFWKWDRNFLVENHVKLVSGAQLDETNICDYIAKTCRDPYGKNRPLWDLSFVPDFNGDKNQSLMIMRIHHSYADGYSLIKLILLGFMGLPELPNNLPKPTKIRRTLWESIRHNLTFIFGLPYIYLREVSKLKDDNPLHDGRELSGQWVSALTPKIPMNEFSNTKVRLSAPFTAILTSAISGGIRTYLEKHIAASQIPNKMHFVYPNPIPGHPDDKLTNHW